MASSFTFRLQQCAVLRSVPCRAQCLTTGFTKPPSAVCCQVFSDADEAFASLRAVKGQLERWRGAYPEAYRDAYVSMSAPALMAPFVRSQLLSWDPLHGSQPGVCSTMPHGLAYAAMHAELALLSPDGLVQDMWQDGVLQWTTLVVTCAYGCYQASYCVKIEGL